MRIRKSGYIESDGTYYCTGKFNTTLSLYKVLRITLYFSKGFSKAAAGKSVVAVVLWPLEMTIVCFLEQESNLWSLTLQQRYRLFSRYFLYLLLVNLPLLASLEERSTHRVLSCFLGAGDRDNFKEVLADETARDRFALFCEAVAKLEVEAFPCFQE